MTRDPMGPQYLPALLTFSVVPRPVTARPLTRQQPLEFGAQQRHGPDVGTMWDPRTYCNG